MTSPILKQAVACAWLAAAGTSAHAVVETGHWHTQPNLGNTNAYVSIDQTVGGDFTGTMFNYDKQAGTLQFITKNIDEGSQLFLTKPGDELSNAAINALPASASFSTPVVVGTDFYLGGRTRSASDPGFSWADPTFYDTFGWAHIHVDASGLLQVVDSAVAFREHGLIAGTTQIVAVPEPSTYMMMGLGLIGLGLARQVQRRRT